MKVRVLFVDDEPAIRELFAEVLRAENIHITSASSAAEAVHRLAAECFDVVITDMRMETPRAGYDVIRAAQQLTPRPKVIVLTAFPLPKSDLGYYEISAVVTKGADIAGMIRIIHDVLASAA